MIIILRVPLGESGKNIFELGEKEKIQFEGELCYLVQENETGDMVTNSIIPIWNIVAILRK